VPDHAGFCGVSSLDKRAIVLYVKWGLSNRNSESGDTLVQAETGMRRRPLTQQFLAPRPGQIWALVGAYFSTLIGSPHGTKLGSI